ncbi:catechol O-methyltransferase-like isoform X2 [Hyla sarda]|nr:catechol O-methyltransferase-like isoform X2 [Hyla sarda]XP_056373003.1 catechol O-methyltransferase-like isoform X2 [Hyla sarda]XP_056373004.1 catechol O-methyltransferase-like isoform X2 [Hyla sarda]
MENTFTGFLPFLASNPSVIVTGALVPLAAGVAWVLFRYYNGPSYRHGSVGVKTQQALRRYVLFESTHGKPDSVLQAFKEYAIKDHAMKMLLFTVEKDHFLEVVAKQRYPRTTLVLGTQCGYSAIRLLQLLPPDGMLYAVEQDESMAESAEEMILVAGFKNNRFKLLCQHPVDAIRDLKSQFGVKKVDFVLMDQCDRYVEALLAMAEVGILHPGSLILANNTDHPTSEDFRTYIKGADGYRIVDACKGLLKMEYVPSE